MRRNALGWISIGLILVGSAGGPVGRAAPPDPPKAKPAGCGLRGRLTDEADQPLPGAKIVLYGGIATRWKIAETTTEADGRYRVDDVRSSMVRDEKTKRWDQYVGVRVEHPTHVEADGRSWRDIRIPGVAGHMETLDLKMVAGGRVEGVLNDAKTGAPFKQLDLRILNPARSHGHGVTFSAYAKTDDQGRFRSISLFPGEYAIEVNSGTLDYPVLGKVKVEAGKTTIASVPDIRLARVVSGRVVDGAGQPLAEVYVTLLAPRDSSIDVHRFDDYDRVRSRAWTIFRPSWQDHFDLAFLPGLEQARFVLAVHKEQGWAKIAVESLDLGEPIRLQPWPR